MNRPATCCIIGLAAMAGLSGCVTLDPASRPAASPVPAEWPTGAAYGAPLVGPPLADWQGVVVDPKLRTVIGLALNQNRDLRVAVAQIEASRAQYQVQRAALLPTVDAQLSANDGRSYTGYPTTPGGSPYATEHLYSASVGVTSYELDLFGRLRSLTRAAREQYLATEDARRSIQISLVAETAGDYLSLAADTSLLATANQTLASAQASLDLTRHRFEGGIASRLDVANAGTVVDQARADIGRYTTQVAQDRNALNLVVGAPVPADLLPSGIDDPATRLAVASAGLTSSILLRRPDVAEAEHQLRAAKANIGAARAAFFPQVDLTASGGSTTTSLASLFAPGSGAWSFTPTITLPIFDAGKNRANLAYARAQDRIALAQYEKAIQTAFRETADALADRGTIDARLAAAQSGVKDAQEGLDVAQALYARGSGAYLDVLTAQRTLYAAQQSLISIRLARDANLVTLYKVLGGGLADRRGGG